MFTACTPPGQYKVSLGYPTGIIPWNLRQSLSATNVEIMKTTVLTACALALAGCAGIAGTTPPVPAAGARFDGSYVGQDTLLSGVAFLCGAANLPERIEVQNGQFGYPFQVNPPRVAPLHVQIFEDGTLAGQMQYGTLLQEDLPMFFFPRTDWVTLRGRITGAELEATITNIRCVRLLRVQRQ